MASAQNHSGSGGRARSHGGSSSTTRDKNIGTIQADLFTRPSPDFDKRGSAGRTVVCVTNFVPVETFPEFVLHQYHVSFSPPVDSKLTRKLMLKSFDKVLGVEFIFDGMILYSPKTDLGDNFDLAGKHPTTNESVTVTIRRTVSFTPNDPQAINIYNLLVRRSFEAIGYQQITRNFYDPTRAASIPNYHIELWPGYVTAIRLHEEKLLMCVENSHKLLRAHTVYDLMMEAYRSANGNTEAFKRQVTSDVIGNTVMTLYNNKLYRVDDIMWDMNPESTLTKFDGTTITFTQYYKQQYNKDVTDMKQPLLFSRAKNRGQSAGQMPAETRDVYLVPELCNLTGLTDAMRSDRKVMQALAVHTRLTPIQRIQSSLEYLNKFHNTPEINQVFSRWQVTLGKDLARVQARELPPEELTGRSPRPYSYNAASGDWARQAKDAGCSRTVNMNMWMLLFLPQDRQKAEHFFATIRDMARSMGMIVDMPFVGQVANDQTSSFIEKITEGFGEAKGRAVEMIVVVVPNDNKTRYDAIKKVCCLERPVPTQVIRSPTLANEKNFSSVCLKVLLQMNCKMGGSLWKVSIPMKNAMILGYDLYHDSTQRGKTVGAAVSSLDKDFTSWYSQCELHGNPTELGENLGKFVEEALKQWYERNDNTLPGRVFIYRDGCGDGQIPFVKITEVRLVNEAMRTVGKLLGVPDYAPGLAFVIVTKRVNIRYFKREENGQLLNPAPGTVVDSVITRPERFDFYLVPQCVRQGTVTPVNYNVIEDSTGLTADQHQRLAYKLCHLYYNWQGTIRVPAPCQYAQKLAFLVSQSLHESAKECLRNKLYFL